MDATDRKILALLQQDASLSVAEIGSRVGLSSTPCWKRIQRLEADGILQKRVALVDQDKIGLGVTVFVSIETGDHSGDWLDRFAQVVGAMPEVMEFYRMAGDVDYMLRVVVTDIQGYDAFYKRLIAAVPLKNVTSRFAMEKIKSTTALPIPMTDDRRRKTEGGRRTTEDRRLGTVEPAPAVSNHGRGRGAAGAHCRNG
jgi:Lrp/AsnC family transcriptional regulator